jgi:hypothetical protein
MLFIFAAIPYCSIVVYLKEGVMPMGDIPDSSSTWPVPPENVTGIGVAGPPTDKTEVTEEKVNTENSVHAENSEFSEVEVGHNIDIKA